MITDTEKNSVTVFTTFLSNTGDFGLYVVATCVPSSSCGDPVRAEIQSGINLNLEGLEEGKTYSFQAVATVGERLRHEDFRPTYTESSSDTAEVALGEFFVCVYRLEVVSLTSQQLYLRP